MAAVDTAYPVGTLWNFDNDLDIWAFAYPDMVVKLHQHKSGPHKVWAARQKYSTRPLNRCQEEQIEDPLLIPDRVSGSFVKYQEAATQDRFGNASLSSSHEPIKGSIVEFDANRPTVKIEQNVASLGLEVFSEMVDTVNDAELWDLSARKIKLSNVTWVKKWNGTCDAYYTREFDFDINFQGFDRVAQDEGNKCLNGEWDETQDPKVWVTQAMNGGTATENDPDPDDPTHFIRFTDAKGNLARTLLDGDGRPLGTEGAQTGTDDTDIHIEKYDESDFLLLGIPTEF
jgi:hypothetical protein